MSLKTKRITKLFVLILLIFCRIFLGDYIKSNNIPLEILFNLSIVFYFVFNLSIEFNIRSKLLAKFSFFDNTNIEINKSKEVSKYNADTIYINQNEKLQMAVLHDDDKKLLDNIVKVMEPVYEHFRNTDLSTLYPVDLFNEWLVFDGTFDRIGIKFVNAELDAIRVELIKAVDEFCVLLAVNNEWKDVRRAGIFYTLDIIEHKQNYPNFKKHEEDYLKLNKLISNVFQIYNKLMEKKYEIIRRGNVSL